VLREHSFLTTKREEFMKSETVLVPETIKVLLLDGTVETMDMDEYLKGVVPMEMSPSWPKEALKAQAVAARCYAATARRHSDQGADVCTTTHCQAWSATHYDTVDQAVNETHGIVAVYEGSIISAYFFSHCDGHTRNSEDVWVQMLPYCRSVPCECGHESLSGHGVGMCQHGAKAMAERGASYEDIIKHYYTGVSLQSGVEAKYKIYLPLVMKDFRGG
jgi:peptidoglycan hydrolase-like amidase